MSPIYIRRTDTYLVKHLPNLQFEVDNTDSIPIGEGVWISFRGFLWEHEGVKERCLYIFTQIEVEGDAVRELFNKKESLTDVQKNELEEIVHQKIASLPSKAQNLVNKFRWLTGLKFDIKLTGESVPLQWSCDQNTWEKIPAGQPEPNFVISGQHGNEPTSIINKEFINENIAPYAHLNEPLGHDLLYEAIRLLESFDHRGAFLLGFTALEVGVKEFIAKSIPQTAWLMENSPSPDIYRLCTKYLPTIDERLSIEKTLESRLIEKYMQHRNTLVHRGKFEENFETILKKLKMVEYMLYRFDYCSGVDRALLYANYAKEEMVFFGKEDMTSSPEKKTRKRGNDSKGVDR